MQISCAFDLPQDRTSRGTACSHFPQPRLFAVPCHVTQMEKLRHGGGGSGADLEPGCAGLKAFATSKPRCVPCLSPGPFLAPSATQGTPPSGGPSATHLLQSPFRDPWCMYALAFWSPWPPTSLLPCLEGHRSRGPGSVGTLECRAMARLVPSKVKATAAPKAMGLPPTGLLARAEPTIPCARAARH